MGKNDKALHLEFWDSEENLRAFQIVSILPVLKPSGAAAPDTGGKAQAWLLTVPMHE